MRTLTSATRLPLTASALAFTSETKAYQDMQWSSRVAHGPLGLTLVVQMFERGQLHTLAAAIIVALVAACTSDSSSPPSDLSPTVPTSSAHKLQPFESCETLDDYLTDVATDTYIRLYTTGYFFGGVVLGGDGFDDAQSATADGRAEESGPTDFTTTNVQEAGVDEPDLLKTDGQYHYYIRDSVLYVIDSWPPEDASAIARVELDGWGESMFLVDDSVVTFTSIYEEGRTRGRPESPPFSGVRVTIINVSDPANPRVRRKLDIEGQFLSARLVEGVAYAVTTHTPQFNAELQDRIADAGLPDSQDPVERPEVTEEARRRVRSIISDYVKSSGRSAIIPDVRTDGIDAKDLLECNQIMRPGRRSDLAMLTVSAIEPTAAGTPKGVGLLANGWQVYGSTTSLYVAQDSRWWWWEDDAERFTETHIHQFQLNDGDPTYAASGAVRGWIIGQFAMSEHQGHLRIATTDQTLGQWWWGPLEGDVAVAGDAEPGEPPSDEHRTPRGRPPEPSVDANNVFVLRRDSDELAVVGEVRGIAPGEQIFAVRFVGDKGYVVTFRQTDPLFTIDLSDPAAPQVMGELHITGFSTYLHPLGDTHLIGIGREGTEDGRILGLQVQMFDVSDFSQPRRIHQTVLSTGARGSSGSEAEHDHRAFTFYQRDNLLALPVTLESQGRRDDAYRYFSGVIVYKVSVEDGFVEIGRVSHSGLGTGQYCVDDALPEGGPDTPCERADYGWWANMRRSAFVDDYLFAFSDLGVTASTVWQLDTPVAVIPLRR